MDRVLVIDDEEPIRRGLEKCLRRLGYEVITSGDGDQGLKTAIDQAPEVILTDLRMSGMDGHTLLRRLAANRVRSSVVVMSGHGEMDDVVEALRHGAVDFLKKPWSQAEVVAAISRAAEIYQERKQHSGAGPDGEPTPMAAQASPMEATQTEFFQSILSRLRSGEITLSPVPRVVSELRTLCAQPEIELNRFISLVESNPGVAAMVLKLSNTAAYECGSGQSDLRAALQRIGPREIHALAEGSLLNGCYEARHQRLRPLQLQIRRHSVGRAVVMRALARTQSTHTRIDPDAAFLLGLVADVGASFLLWAISECHSSMEVDQETSKEVLDFVQAHHEEVGARVLGHWGMDEALVEVALHHHGRRLPSSLLPMSRLFIVASEVAQRIGHPDVTSSFAFGAELVDRLTREIGVDPEGLDGIAESLADEVKALVEIMGQT